MAEQLVKIQYKPTDQVLAEDELKFVLIAKFTSILKWYAINTDLYVCTYISLLNGIGEIHFTHMDDINTDNRRIGFFKFRYSLKGIILKYETPSFF